MMQFTSPHPAPDWWRGAPPASDDLALHRAPPAAPPHPPPPRAGPPTAPTPRTSALLPPTTMLPTEIYPKHTSILHSLTSSTHCTFNTPTYLPKYPHYHTHVKNIHNHIDIWSDYDAVRIRVVIYLGSVIYWIFVRIRL